MRSMGRVGLALGGVLVLAACSGGGGGAASPGASVTAVPSATPFGTTLSQALEPVNAGLGKVAAATTMKEVETALATVESNADRAVRSLKAAGVPDGADAARTELVTGLNTLSSEVLTIRADLNSKKYCTVGVVQAQVGGGQGLVAVPAALAKLAAAGQQAAFTVPQLPKPQPQPRGLENGTLVRDGGNHGEGELVFDNNGAVDAVVSVVQDGASVASIYVVKGQRAGIEGIKAGSFAFHYTTGVDWDPEGKRFTQDCRFVKVGDGYAFKPSGTTWTLKARAEDGKPGTTGTWLTADTAPSRSPSDDRRESG
ncbi:hypothetical protein ABZW03_21670 [Kitasatospora sp. NPDC004799]|uniref:hypothetical protein n=1 Tax=Kitasatospora sp. NPDC004799 TaxID=3154460 RepID=UPI0033B4EB36